MEGDAKGFDSQMRSLWALAGQGILLCDAQGTLLFANPEAERLLGYAPTELDGVDLVERLLTPERRAPAREAIRRIFEGGAPPVLDAPLRREYLRKDGSRVELEVTFSYLPDAQPPSLALLLREVKPLDEADAAVRAAFGAGHEAIFILEADSTICNANEAAERLSGCTAEELLGRRMVDLLVPAEQRAEAEALMGQVAALRVEDGVLTAQRLYQRKDGRRFRAEAHFRKYRFDSDKRIVFVRELGEQARMLQEVWDASLEGTIIERLDGSIVEANPEACRLLGYRREELLGKNFIEELLLPAYRPTARAAMQSLKERGRSEVVGRPRRREYSRADGSILQAEVRFAFLQGTEAPLVSVFFRDVRAHEHALALMEAIFEAGHEGVLLLSPDGVVLRSNRKGAELIGYSSEELLGQDLGALLLDKPELSLYRRRLQLLKEMPAKSEPLSFSRTYRRKDGSALEAEAHVAKLDESPGHLLFFLKDLAAERKAQEAVLRSRELLGAIVDQSPYLMLVGDLQGRMLYASRSAKALLGWEPEELVGKEGFEIYQSDELTLGRHNHARLLKREIEEITREVRLLRKDGGVRRMRMTVRMLPEDGPTQGFLFEAHDLEAEIAANAERERVQKMLDAALRAGIEGVIVLDRDAKIRSFNPAMERLSGYSKEEALGRSMAELLVSPEDRAHAVSVREKVMKLPADGEELVIQRRYRRKDGSILHAQARVLHFADHENDLVIFIRDLGAEMMAAAQEQRSRELFRSMVELSPDLVTRAGEDGVMNFVSANVRDFLGWEPEELRGQHFSSFLHPQDQARAKAAFEGALKGASQRVELRLKHKDGRWLAFDCHGRLIQDPDGQPQVIVQSRSVHQQLALFEAMVRNAVGLLVVFDAAGQVLYVSPSSKAVLGWEPEALRALPTEEWIHPDERADARVIHAKVVSGETPDPRSLRRFRCADGAYKRLRTSYMALPKDGAVQGFLLQGEDVEASLQAEESLAAREELYRSIVDNSTDLLALLGPDGRIEQASPSLLAAFEVPMEAMLGLRLLELAQAEDRGRLEGALERARLGARPERDLDLQLALPSGKHTYAIRLLHLGEDREGRILFRGRDVEQERESQAKIMQFQRLAVFGQLAAGFAHEVRNPLAGIVGAAQLARRRSPAESPVQEQLEVVLRQAERLRSLMDDILLHARSQRVEIGLVDPCNALARAAESAQQQFGPGAGKIQIERVQRCGNARVEVAEDRLQRLLHNLILNAMQALPAEGGRIALICELKSGELSMRVEDDGPGLKPEDAQRAFEPFFSTKAQGSGLGLWIAQSLAQEMGGRLRYEPVLPHGAAFTLTLPAA